MAQVSVKPSHPQNCAFSFNRCYAGKKLSFGSSRIVLQSGKQNSFNIIIFFTFELLDNLFYTDILIMQLHLPRQKLSQAHSSKMQT